ncbi:MAG: DUF3489 domain-containing protein [Pseudomonadota bacterium]|nr:DUF3489 domain-containing protein [Pseudomonadota bacterium]
MAIKLSETQRDLLGAAAQRDDRFFTLPEGRRTTAARHAAAPLLAAGLAREIKARGDAPVWRSDKDSQCAFALKLTAAGMRAVANLVEVDESGSRGKASSEAEPELGRTERQSQEGKKEIANEPPTASRAAPRSGTKIDRVLKMLDRPEGATLEAMANATGWLPHTTSAALTGLRRRGYILERSRDDAVGASVYRLRPTGC